MSLRALSALLPVVFVVLASSRAAADRAVIVVAGAKGNEAEVVAAATREVVVRASWSVIEPKLPPERVAEVMKCAAARDSACIGRVLDEAGADRLITFKISDDKYKNKPVRVVVVQILRRGADVLASGQRYCEACRDDLLADLVRSVMTGALLDARRALNPTKLVIQSVPAGALVQVDGQPIGPTPVDRPIDPGTHTIEVQAKDHRAFSQEVTVADGEIKKIVAKLEPLTPGHRIGEPPGGSQSITQGGSEHSIAPWLVIGGGAALAAGGGVLLWLDEDDTSNGHRVPSYRDTALGGGALVVAGAAVATAGVIWYMRERNASDEAPRPTVTIENGGARIGIAGSF